MIEYEGVTFTQTSSLVTSYRPIQTKVAFQPLPLCRRSHLTVVISLLRGGSYPKLCIGRTRTAMNSTPTLYSEFLPRMTDSNRTYSEGQVLVTPQALPLWLNLSRGLSVRYFLGLFLRAIAVDSLRSYREVTEWAIPHSRMISYRSPISGSRLTRLFRRTALYATYDDVCLIAG